MKDKANIRIVDIAKMAGVSAGTVDRVLHKRGRVSEEKRLKIEKVLKEIDYKPNIAASFLASKRNYLFAVIAPAFLPGDYWELMCDGINRAVAELKTFNVKLDYFGYNQYDQNSFLKAIKSFNKKEYSGVIITTHYGDEVIKLSKELSRKNTPYIYIDSDISGQNNLAYFGSDSFVSGNIAAKLMVQEIGLKSDVVITHIKFKRNDISVQMRTREQGISQYLNENGFLGKVHHVEIDPDNCKKGISYLGNILQNAQYQVGGVVLNSRIYELLPLLNKIDKTLLNKLILGGYDAVKQNINALKNGQVKFLLSQRPELQGYDAVKALGNYFVFKQAQKKNNYMPIDILIKENIDYYNNYKL